MNTSPHEHVLRHGNVIVAPVKMSSGPAQVSFIYATFSITRWCRLTPNGHRWKKLSFSEAYFSHFLKGVAASCPVDNGIQNKQRLNRRNGVWVMSSDILWRHAFYSVEAYYDLFFFFVSTIAVNSL
ncbi:hypothetical protein CEXT_281231 [Caerostris extrusa]|uniref:Uncharacterized protein n=1 Tax=Caerostris extrusa TaxID=172846 RepID=A0AAV4XZG1_CAEEX|nr:hypothetical protein CEXT_281231 [Caerostris extrusa]